MSARFIQFGAFSNRQAFSCLIFLFLNNYTVQGLASHTGTVRGHNHTRARRACQWVCFVSKRGSGSKREKGADVLLFPHDCGLFCGCLDTTQSKEGKRGEKRGRGGSNPPPLRRARIGQCMLNISNSSFVSDNAGKAFCIDTTSTGTRSQPNTA